MSWLHGFFSAGPAHSKDDDAEYSAAIERAEKVLQGRTEDEARYLACAALLMARVANADSEISEGERAKMQVILVSHMMLSQDAASAVTSVALESALTGAIDLHIVIRRVNELATRDQKFSIIRALFHVAAVDDISDVENAEIDLLAQGLLLSRAEFIALRSEFREHLALLKNLPR